MAVQRFHLPLFIGDLIMILLFTALGMVEHGTGPTIGRVMITAISLVVTWSLIALWLGAFRQSSSKSVKTAFKTILLPWLLTVPLGLQLRVLILHRAAPMSFALVTFIVGGFLLAIWRITYTFFSDNRGN